LTLRPALQPLPILLIAALALALRLSGIEWGLPNSLHYLSYHPDETVMLVHSTTRFGPDGLDVFAGQFLPHFYNYGSLQLVLINIAISVVSAYSPGRHLGGDFAQQLFTCYLTGRVLTALMGTATVYVLWALGRRAYSDPVGLSAALMLAIAPLHLQHSHFMTVDVPATLWVTLALLWAVKAVTDDNQTRALVVAGCFAGLAAATKYNCALVLLPVSVAALTNQTTATELNKTQKTLNCLAACAAAAVAYLAACPGTILESRLFVHDFLFEAKHVSSQQELWFQGTGIGWWYIARRNLVDGLGAPLLLTAVAGAVYAVRKHNFADLTVLAFALPYYLLVSAAQSRYARYEIPLLPVLCLLASRFMVELTGQTLGAKKRGAQLMWAGVVAYTAASAAFMLAPFLLVDPRDRACEWLNNNVPADAEIGMPDEPWFWTPPLSPYFSMPGPGQWIGLPDGEAEANRIVPFYGQQNDEPTSFDSRVLTGQSPPVVVMSEYEYFDRLRLRKSDALNYMAVLSRRYTKPIVFAAPHWLGGIRYIDGLPCQDLPHDMLYDSATVLIFKRIG
jgi:hypothetical protein